MKRHWQTRDVNSMEKCEKCAAQTSNKNIIFETKEICACTKICDECMLEVYIIYNFSPIIKLTKCEFCKQTLNKNISNWLFNFTTLYFASEGPFEKFYI